ncbi:amino acid transporter AVT1I-like isoform X2 [Humulus lupulus]|uniref:amino acid transporter AVT1I-like isoform X2 n=1 Tax=Humulus lupulus TaxID=3486 RepID=UPI002B40C1B2|nr:amino acid transporter AVT1I-like isoform X2 [Humulus lupulus]
MEAEQRVSLTLPLVSDDKHGNNNGLSSKLEEVESNHPQATTSSTSFFKTCFNGLNALSGVGILSVPYALATGGWLSLTLFFTIATAAFYSGLLIKRCMDYDSNIRTYPDIGERAFGNKGRMIVSIAMYTELYLVSAGFLILEASGVLASAIILFSIVWTGAFDGVGFHQKGTPINWSGIPTAMSLYAFCYCAHPVFPTLYTSMKNKHQFSNVLLLCFIICTVGYASIAVFGYLMFGSGVQSQITLDLPTGKLSSRIAIYTTLVNPIAKYALMVTPIIDAVKNGFPCFLNKKLFGIIIGTALVISSVIVALVVPFFASLMSLVGAVLSLTASIIMPCLCYLKISGIYRTFNCELVFLVVMILMGVVFTIIGTYTSVLDILVNLQM